MYFKILRHKMTILMFCGNVCINRFRFISVGNNPYDLKITNSKPPKAVVYIS